MKNFFRIRFFEKCLGVIKYYNYSRMNIASFMNVNRKSYDRLNVTLGGEICGQ